MSAEGPRQASDGGRAPQARLLQEQSQGQEVPSAGRGDIKVIIVIKIIKVSKFAKFQSFQSYLSYQSFYSY